MKASFITKLIQDESTPSNSQSPIPLLPPTEQSTPASDEQLALFQFRRLLADYQRAGYEYAQHIYQLTRR